MTATTLTPTHTTVSEQYEIRERGTELAWGGYTVSCSCGETCSPRATKRAARLAQTAHRNDVKIAAKMGIKL